MKKIDFKNIKIPFFKKYDYKIDEVIGVKGNDRFILYTQNKLIRIYRGNLKSKALLSTYIPIENAIFYSFEIEKSVLERVDLDEFIETKVYEEAGVDETEEYIIKYKIIDSLKDEKHVIIEAIIVPSTYIENGYKDILQQSGYIDYISFPAFAYEALYEEKIIKKANDLFVVFLYDKVFLTFYTEGELLSIVTISGGLDKVYDALKKLKIKNFDKNIFEKILTKKGVNPSKYSKYEKIVLETIQNEFTSIMNIIDSQIDSIKSKYNISEIERIFLTSEFGNIDGLKQYIEKLVNIDTFGFEFYEEYNLDRLVVNPFLFLGMLEAHHAYKHDDQYFNFSPFLRKPTFFYRPSGKLLSIIVASIVIMGAYPLYLYINGLIYESKNKTLSEKINKLNIQNIKLRVEISKLNKTKKAIIEDNSKYTKIINKMKQYIKDVYEFKYSYLPKSAELTDITLLLNKNKVYLNDLKYNDGVYTLDVFAFNEINIPNLLDSLVKKGFNIETTGVEMKDNKYYSTIRIKE
jgi:Tfp pilus assembly PilM family ATPase